MYNKPIVERKDDPIKDDKIDLERRLPARIGSLGTIVFLVVVSVPLLTAVSTNLMPYSAGAAVDIDVSGEGRAAAYDGEQRLSTEGDSFCSITEEVAEGVFSSLFEGIAECDNDSSHVLNQFVVDYSFTKNPVIIGEQTVLSLTIKDKNSGDPITGAIVNLKVLPSVPSFETETVAGGASFAAAAAGSTSRAVQEMENTVATQTMRTDNNGHAMFTIKIGPKSDLGVYDTEIEVTKDSYESSMSQTYLRVV